MKRSLLTLLFLAAAPLVADEKKMPILLMLTNHGQLGDTGKKTGFYLSEAAHPYEVFTEAGYEVTLASPKGGMAPLDPKSLELEDKANEAFWSKFGNGDDEAPGVAGTMALSDVKPGEYRGIFFAGGHGAMWDFPTSAEIRAVTASIYSRGGVVGAVCHGPAALVNLKLPDGSVLVSGKKVAVFTDEEEKAVELMEVMPFSLQQAFEDMLSEVVLGEKFTENAVRDGRLITGQNPTSARKAAELFVEAMKTVGPEEQPEL